MNNKNAAESIKSCKDELQRISSVLDTVGTTSPMASYLSKYSLILVSGTIEYCVKAILSDVHSSANQQLRNYIDVMIRNNSMNPSLDNIHSVLKKFDAEWNDKFKEKLGGNQNSKRITDSLQSLNSLRNQLAHGKFCAPSFESTRMQFIDAVEIVDILDSVVII